MPTIQEPFPCQGWQVLTLRLLKNVWNQKKKQKKQVPAARFIDYRSYIWSLHCITSGLSYYSLCWGWETAGQRAILHSAFFPLLLNRQRKNSTGNASHHILLWWMCWPRPCMSCLQPLTVSLCLPLHLITLGEKNNDRGIRHDCYSAVNKH